MSKIGLSEGFTVIPEGTYVFKITNVKYKEDFGKMEIVMQTQNGAKHIERFSLLKSDGSPNEGGLNAFSYFAKTALKDYSLTEIDHEDLIGHFIECDVEHDVQPNKNKPDKTVTFIRLTEKRPSDGWGNEEPKTSSSAKKETSETKPSLNLKELLG